MGRDDRGQIERDGRGSVSRERWRWIDGEGLGDMERWAERQMERDREMKSGDKWRDSEW